MIKDIVAANEKVKPNDKKIEKLKDLFPNCVMNDGSFDIELLKSSIEQKVDITREGYDLKFLGKSYAKLLASLDTTTVIQPDEEHNHKPENKDSENIYISGDNIDALKHLIKSYSGKVKCIYIDPPYNTGSDGFAYNDNFNFTVEELVEKLSLSEEEAARVIDLTTNGRASHSAWLTFMYPRLQIARDLLKDDGVIFISIDENELSNLLFIGNEIFGEENQIAQLVWQKRHGGGNDSTFVAVDHEYVLVYARNYSADIHKEKWRIPYDDRYLKRYSEIDERGNRYYWDTLARDGLQNPIIVEIPAPDGSVIRVNSQKSQDTVNKEVESGTIKIARGREGWMVHHRVYQPKGRVLRSILKDVGTNSDSSNEIIRCFGVSVFDYSKPVSLINRLFELAPIKDGDIILDFFSGSGTTGEVVLKNKIAKKLSFIMVQLPENIDNQYNILIGEKKEKVKRTIDFLDSVNRPHTLDQIGIERIIRVGKKIKEENPDTTADLGFKHYNLVEPSQNTLDKIEKFNGNELITDMPVLDEFGVPTILTTWLERDGYGLNPLVKELDIAGYTIYHCKRHLYLIMPGIVAPVVEYLIEKYHNDGEFSPENIVLFGYSFSWTETEILKSNLARMKDKEKNLRFNFEVRY